MQMNIDELHDGVFHVWQPNSAGLIAKSTDAVSDRWSIGGYASTEDEDRQGESVMQKGLDFSEFVTHGWFNDNHQQHAAASIGVPELARYDKGKGWWTEGYLLKNVQRAVEVYNLAKSLEVEAAHRKLGFSIEGKILERLGNKIVKALIRNVAITNCFPGDVEVVGTGEAITRRWYSGPMVEVVLSSGQKLTGTPNHPVLTQRGWVALGQLDKLHDRVGCRVGDLLRLAPQADLPSTPSRVVPHDEDHMPSKLQELFDLASVDAFGVPRWVSTVREGQFHGDMLSDGEVEVVLLHGFLKRRLDTVFAEKFGKNALAASDKELALLSRLGAFPLHLDRILRATADGLRLLDPEQARSLLRGAHPSVSSSLFLGLGARDAVASSHKPDALSGDSVLGRDSGRRFSPAIGFCDIRLKRCFEFSGHVYNLQTEHGWYSANGIVAHNSPVNTNCTWGMISKSWANDLDMKALAVGHAVAPSSGGRVLVPQDLEQGEVKYIYQCPECRKAFGNTGTLEAHMSAHARKSASESVVRRPARLLTRGEAVEYIQRLHPEYGEAVTHRLVDLVFSQGDEQ